MINELLSQTESEEVKWYINTVIRKYQDKIDQGEAEHLVDYLSSSEAPTRLRKMSIKDAKRKSKEWVDRMIKKAGDIIETEEDTKLIEELGNGLKLVKLIGEDSFKREGNLMGHCVGGYYNKNDSTTYSIRDKNNNPHCTLEVITKNNQIQQLKGKGNGPIHPKYIKEVIKALKVLGLELRLSEYINLGYIKVSSEMEEFITTKFKGDKWLTVNNTKLFYKNSTLKDK